MYLKGIIVDEYLVSFCAPYESVQYPTYKTLDIIEFYNQVYDFVSRYLIFVLAGIFAIIAILVIWIREPSSNKIITRNTMTGSEYQWYIQETWLIYPVNYFAEGSLNFEWDNKIFWLGWPIWRNQWMWNSIDNVVQYNWVILPRQISRSAWVPKLQQAYYTESMIKTFLEWMGTSHTDSSLIKATMDTVSKKSFSGSMISYFEIGCSARSIFITTFCDLKIIDAINQWNEYDLSKSTDQLAIVYSYLFKKHPNSNIQKARCNAMIQQYRYSANPNIAPLTLWCSKKITNEIAYIGNMVVVNEEIKSNKYTTTIYNEPSINRYKLMSWYQYFMMRIKADEFTSKDVVALTDYNSYIIKLANEWVIVQPYGDIIATFHQTYLTTWLDRRESFATSNEQELTQELKTTTNTIIYGDAIQWIVSINSWSRIRSNDFLIAQWWYYETSNTSSSSSDKNTSNNESTWWNNIQDNSQQNLWTGSTKATSIATWQTLPTTSALDWLISQVLGTAPTSPPIKKWQLILIKYTYKWKNRFAAVDLSKNGTTQVYYDSPVSGATKITHPQVIFNTSNKELIAAIMDNYIRSNPVD
jgi:hypothetical protein